MSSRDKILAAVQANKPATMALPDIGIFETNAKGSLEKFATVLTTIGGKVVFVSGYDEIKRIIAEQYGGNGRIVSPVTELKAISIDTLADVTNIHDLQDVEVALLNARFGVAENGAVWVTEDEMDIRVLPFVTQHLALIINADTIVPTMHQAYELIGNSTYGFGAFIAGPSKTADIEQSLVIGAHGPRSMTVFVLNTSNSG